MRKLSLMRNECLVNEIFESEQLQKNDGIFARALDEKGVFARECEPCGCTVRQSDEAVCTDCSFSQSVS